MATSRLTLPWVREFIDGAGPRYLQIVAMIEEAVRAGGLRPGERLPPQRELAGRLGVDLTTVTRAYTEARHRGLIDAMTGRGSFIAARPEASAFLLDLSMNIPPPPKGVRLAEKLESGLAEVLRRSDVDLLMSYHIGAGSLADRSAGGLWLAPLLGSVDPQRVIISPGAQPALAALLGLLARPGEAVVTDRLVYPGLRTAARQRELTLLAAAGDAEGMLPEALDATLAASGARLVYLTPTIQNPTTATLSAARREALAEIVRRRDAQIIEDDPYARLAGDAPPPLAALAPERTYHVATLSKTLTPGLRTAFVVAPSARHGEALVAMLRGMVLMPSPLLTALAVHWIRLGVAEELLEGVRREAAERQRAAAEILPISGRAHPNGLHVWLPLPSHWDRHRLIEAARQEGLGVTPSDAFCIEGRAPDAVRLSLGGIPDRARLVTALRKLADILEGGHVADPLVV
ncbi:PLP-dependent aminotransferase family protein [Ancylobacter oerskovii]|uniref:PLP-dependent aminotransferase family protein n=1 Tax=Ancylobacter oerskovii TaxID=459519 RepID=A0ABW4YW18_9HYPH|nr:PLP-dependent aminotransferase family protein [Ancylobacter oerskovii]MBS7543112.1 PLP-dependent aminotransferase family protein [Ancylobacter oerskovii]